MFQTTLWSRIGDAQRGDSGAVEAFVARYQQPLIRFVRQKGFGLDAEDLVQEVFLRLLVRDLLARADASRGRFRSFLLGVTKNVIGDELSRRRALKRGGGKAPVPLEDVAYDLASPSEDESLFEQLWSQHLLSLALSALEKHNPRYHQSLLLHVEKELPYLDIAEHMSRSLQQVKNDIHRARRWLVAKIKEEIKEYSSTQEEYDDELSSFMRFLGER